MLGFRVNNREQSCLTWYTKSVRKLMEMSSGFCEVFYWRLNLDPSFYQGLE